MLRDSFINLTASTLFDKSTFSSLFKSSEIISSIPFLPITQGTPMQISEKPPLRRVINYTDHDLCNRDLPPRTPPNPQTRSIEVNKG